MKKILMVIIALSFLSIAFFAQSATSPTLRWFGQSCFLVTSFSGAKLIIDPFSKLAYPLPAISVNAVLVSHEHPDHNNVGLYKGAVAILRGLKNNGAAYNDIDQSVAGFHVKSFPSFHDDSGGNKRGKNTIFLIEFDGLRLVHLGDLGHTLDENTIKAVGNPDVLMIPVGGVYTIGPAEAWKVVAQLKPTVVVPMHYQTNATANIPIKPLDEFLASAKVPVKKLSTVTTPLVMPKTQEIWVFPTPPF